MSHFLIHISDNWYDMFVLCSFNWIKHEKRPGILEASVSLATSSGRFVYDTETTGPRDIIEAIKSLGFEASLDSNDSKKDRIDHSKEIKK